MKKIVIVSNTGWYLYNFRFKLIKELSKKYGVEKLTVAQLGGIECAKCHY